ncbi:MAG: hypothetical protein MHM6MM_009027 [Cercozoa sp. M6MM]
MQALRLARFSARRVASFRAVQPRFFAVHDESAKEQEIKIRNTGDLELYFKERDQRLIHRLVKKLQDESPKQAEILEKKGGEQGVEKALDELEYVLEMHGIRITKALVADLVEWSNKQH